MQPMPMMPMSQQPGPLGYEQLVYYRGWYFNIKEQNEQMQQEQQSTYALYSTGSPTLHQAHEQHQERTGGQAGLALQNRFRRPPKTYSEWKHDDYIDDDLPPRTVSELNHDHDIDEDIEDIGACRAVE